MSALHDVDATREAAPLKPVPHVIRHSQDEDFTVYEPAGFLLRWYALALDVAFFVPLNVLVHMPFDRYLERLTAYGEDVRYAAMRVLLSAVPLLLYVVAPTMIYGRTLGKYIVGVRVVRASFSPVLTLRQVVMRETAGKLFSLLTLGFGFLMVGFNVRRRALHDHVADTQVISYRRASPAVAEPGTSGPQGKNLPS